MKKHAFAAAVVVVLLTVTVLARAQEPMIPGANAAPPGPQPKIEVEDPLYNFGAATEGTMVNHTFKVKNVGKARLVIRGVRTSCGCTAAKPAKTNLAPGEDAAITAGFDTRFQKGHQERTITVFTNDPETPQAIMTMQGIVKQQVAAVPEQAAFGTVKQGTEATKEVLVEDLTGQKNFKVGAVTNSNPNIKVTKEKRPDGKPGALIKITLGKNLPPGDFVDAVNVVTSRIPLKIGVFGTITGDLSVAPAQVSFGIVQHGQGKTAILTLKNQGQKPVKVLAIDSDAPAVSASAQPVDGGKEYKITVELHRGTPDGQIRGNLKIKTDDPEQKVVSVPFYGIVGHFQI